MAVDCRNRGIDGDAVVDGRAEEVIERLTRLEVEEIVVRVTDEQASSFQQPGHTLTCAMQ